jgi:hypothetical protein
LDNKGIYITNDRMAARDSIQLCQCAVQHQIASFHVEKSIPHVLARLAVCDDDR